MIKRAAGSIARRIAPRTMESLEYVAQLKRDSLPLDAADAGQLRRSLEEIVRRLDELEARVASVDDTAIAIDEHRRDTLRIAELTDLVLTRLGEEPGRTRPRVAP